VVTVEQILEYLERRIAEHHLAGDRLALKRDQDVAGVPDGGGARPGE